MAGTATPATTALKKAGIDHRIHTYDHDSRTVSYGAEAVEILGASLGIEPHRVFKTLVVELDTGLAVAVIPAMSSLSLKAVARALGARKARMADPAHVQRSTGYVLGGVSPLGQRTTLPTVIDRSVLADERVLCSAGRRGLEVELAPSDLVRATKAITAAIVAG